MILREDQRVVAHWRLPSAFRGGAARFAAFGPGVGVIDAAVKNFSGAQSRVAVRLKQLRQADEVRVRVAEEAAVPENAGVRGAMTGEHRGTRRIAEWELAVSAIEPHTVRREPVDVRRLRERTAVTTEFAAEVVGDEEEDVEVI